MKIWKDVHLFSASQFFQINLEGKFFIIGIFKVTSFCLLKGLQIQYMVVNNVLLTLKKRKKKIKKRVNKIDIK